ncbi:hypothetical protein NEFER03_0390 [Nematocida sp. LUAm3]|nr:hypothetical protein NEFER03_0390 [Nematocida sp. LUAm3]KAI5175994.1 hypothetical protein NEFER02_1840 [Nematocida sp. LUAm2]KAI5179090.1 hypothetical protein NEFER01_1957 [Nematocida sp. LUAm1]
MFKKYKIQKKPIPKLSVRTKRIEVSKRISDETLRITSMLKHSSSLVRIRGIKEIEKLQYIKEDMIKELFKFCHHDKKEVRALFYRVIKNQLEKLLPEEKHIWETYLFLYLNLLTKYSVISVRKDGLNMLELGVKYFPKKLNDYKKDFLLWLESDEKIVGLDPKEVPWHKEIKKKILLLKNLQKTKHTTSHFSDRIELLHKSIIVNGVSKLF